MLERRSALASAHAYLSATLKIEESPEFSLTQIAGDAAKMARVVGALPEKAGIAIEAKSRTLMKMGPRQFWAVGVRGDDFARELRGKCYVTPLSSSRTRILLEGEPARDVLAKGIALDFHQSVFAPGMFAMTGVHHMPVLIHCIGGNAFHIYALRTFAMSVWDWLTDSALEFADRPA